jgi:hypothetical protein
MTLLISGTLLEEAKAFRTYLTKWFFDIFSLNTALLKKED